MAEWSNAPDSKSGIRLYRIVGSNPTPSASDFLKSMTYVIKFVEWTPKLVAIDIRKTRSLIWEPRFFLQKKDTARRDAYFGTS